MYSSSLEQSNKAYRKLQGLIMVMMEFKKEKLTDRDSLVAFVRRFRVHTKKFLKDDPAKTFQAKMAIRRQYQHEDQAYPLHTN